MVNDTAAQPMETETIQEDGKRHKCKHCAEKFNSIREILAHELTHFKISELPNTNPNQTQQANKAAGAKKKRKRQKKKPSKLGHILDTVADRELKDLVISGLTLCPEGTELNILCQIYQPKPDNLICVYERVSCDLELALNQKFGPWEILPFGSTITGMAFKTSDIDFYVKSSAKFEDFKGEFNAILKLLQASGRFANIIPIRRARVPIIKCTHRLTGYNLDINPTSKIGVLNSEFIARILAFDKRIHPLMLIIKIWAKTWNITKIGLLTNYCLILMVIFFLQRRPVAILPPLKKFQDSVKKKLIDGSNLAFNDKMKNNTKNTENIKQLVQAFFEFYSTFDFESTVISPYLGQVIDRKKFEAGEVPFPEYYDLLKYLEGNKDKIVSPEVANVGSLPINLSRPMVIQDPFCLNQNKLGHLSPQKHVFIRSQFTTAHSYCNESGSSNQSPAKMLITLFYGSPSDQTDVSVGTLLMQNLDQLTQSKAQNQKQQLAPRPQQATQIMSKNSSHPAKFQGCVCRFSPIETELLYVRTYLRKTFPDQVFDKTDINKFWMEKVIDFTDEMLTNIYCLQVNTIDGKGKKKYARTAGQADVHFNKYTVTYELKGEVDVWSGRKQDLRRGNAYFLQEQTELSKKLLTDRKTTHPARLNCVFALKPDQDFLALNLTVDDCVVAEKEKGSNPKNFFNEFVGRMRNFYKAYFEKFTRESN